jgi:hypothetical protein
MTFFDKDFEKFIYSEYGAKNLTELRTVLKHRFLLQYLDLGEDKAILALGDRAHELKIQRMEIEVSSMARCYNDNYDQIDFDI